jgi:hypothetical protein
MCPYLALVGPVGQVAIRCDLVNYRQAHTTPYVCGNNKNVANNIALLQLDAQFA